MTDELAEKMIRLLEEIRDGQRVQLERQAEALANQRDLLAQQRERLAGLSKRATQADDLLARSTKVVAGARIVAFALVRSRSCSSAFSRGLCSPGSPVDRSRSRAASRSPSASRSPPKPASRWVLRTSDPGAVALYQKLGFVMSRWRWNGRAAGDPRGAR